MKLKGKENEKTILRELGSRLKQHRIAMDMTQQELAEKCGISISTEMRIENGEDSKLSNYIKILTVLGLVDNFDMLIPEAQSDYKALFEERVVRKRASKKRNSAPTTWVWGEDEGE